MRRVLIEFGPVTNYVQVESADQSWAVGQKEILKKRISKLEKTYIIGIRRLGIGINQVLLLGMLIFLPGLESDQDRAILVAGVVSVIWSIWWIHQKFLGNAIIRLSPQPAPVYLKLGTQLISWSIGLVGTMISSLILAYLKGWLGLP